MATHVSRIRAWLDTTPLAAIGLALMREATGRTAPLEPIVPSRPARLRADARIGFWALGAGVGTSTTAALVAQRSAAAGRALVVDLGSGAEALDVPIVARLTRLVVVAGARASQLQATFAARQLLL